MAAKVRTEGFALSPYQRRVYRLQAAASPTAYRARCVVEVTGALDPARLEGALASVVRRHEILRTRFERVGGMKAPVQVILPDLRLPIDRTDGYEPSGPSVRLVTHAPDRHTLLVDLPTLCADSRSLDHLVREMAAAYAATRVTAPPVVVQYADFSEWQNQAVDELASDAQDYWQQQWTSDAPVVQLPGLTPDAARQSFAPRHVSVRLTPALAARLAGLASTHRRAADVAVLSCWYVLLWRLSNQDDLVVGLTCEGRIDPQIEEALGLFAACVPMKQRLRRGISFSECLERIGHAVQDAEAWQPTFAWELLERSDNARAAACLQFAFENVRPAETHSADGVTFTITSRDVSLDRFDLRLRCDLAGAAPTLTLDYDSAVCTAEAASRVLALLDQLLISATHEPAQPIERLNLVAGDEQRRLVEEWNRTRAAYPADRCMHELFEEQAARTPLNVAVVCGERQLTYEQLDAQVSKLAARLQWSGIRPDSVVAICAGRSIELVVGLLGVLKAGGAYLPLDPTYPPKRLRFMLEDSGARVVLADADTTALLADVPLPIVRLDADETGTPARTEPRIANRPSPENLAYLIYTSGSSGMPKGTLIPHRGLVNYLTWCRRAYPLSHGSGAFVHSSISFDLTITGLLAPLIAGDTVRLLPESRSIEALGQELSHERDLSLVKLTPSHLRLIGEQLDARDLAGRTHALVIGGENLTAEDVAAWRAHAPATRLFNEYGPTETVVGCCIYEIDAATPTSGSIPIGRPIANTTAYVLDAAMQLAPIGVAGELYIGGAGVARGYLNRPALTAARFVPDPFSSVPGQRLYRTGDLVRYDTDGTLLFLGRIDHQVKLRGMRIELQEIEAVLCQHPNVRASVVSLWTRGAADARLVAYVVPRDAGVDRTTLVDALKAFVQQVLPDHMAPAGYVVMKALPLTANGKVNRDALPDPDTHAGTVRPAHVAPRSDVEQLLVEVWQQALGASRIGIDDDFFALGGNSLLCFQIIHKLHQAGYRLTLHQMFAHQSIRALAPVLETLADVDSRYEPIAGPVPLTPIQHWFFEQSLPNPHHFTQSVLLQTDVVLQPAVLQEALGHVLAHHDALRARFVRDELGWHQHIDATIAAAPVDVVTWNTVPSEEPGAALERVTRVKQESLSLTEGPLVRLVVIDGGPDARTRLLIVCHHIAVDAVSWRILIEDLYHAYEQLRQGAPVRLMQTTPFGRWAQHVEACAQSPALATEAEHWLADEPAVAALPRDRDDGPDVVSSSAAVTMTLSEEDTRAVVQDLPLAFGTRINDVLLTAVASALCAWTGHPSVLLDLESHGRDDTIADVDVSRTIGWFTTLHPVRLSASGASSVEALRSVSAQLRRVPNGGFGYGLLRYLRGDTAIAERLRRMPQAEICFNYVGVLDAPLSGAGIALTAEHPSAAIDGSAQRTHLLDLVGEISGGSLRLHWIYSRHRHDASTIEHIAQHCVESLRSMIAEARRAPRHAAAPEHREPSATLASLVDKVLVGLQPIGSARPLFLAHPSGGMSTVYTDVLRHMGTDRPVYGFQSRGWYPGEEPDTDLTAMTASYVEVMRTIQPVGPYLLAGWSAGAIVAFEMGIQLRRRGETVAFLGIIDQPPPQPDAPWQTDEMLLESMLGHHLPDFAERTSGMTDEARLVYALEQAKKLRFVPEKSDLSEARRLLHIFRITQTAVRAYVPSAYDGAAVLFRAERQPDVAWAANPTFGWDRYVAGGVEVHQVAGHHQNVLEEPRARALGERLRSCIEHAEASHAGQRTRTAPQLA